MNINLITNIFGAVAGIPQIVMAVAHAQNGNYPEAISKFCEGVGLFVVSYFIGKPTTPPTV